MSFSLVMQAPFGTPIGGLITGSPSGTNYTTDGNGRVTVTSNQDVTFLSRLGFYPVSTFANKISVSSPLPADLISVVAAATPANGATTIAGQPAQARKLQYRIVIGTTTTTAITAGTYTQTGEDQDGNAISETISLVENASATIKSAFAWSQVNAGTIAGYVASGSGTGNTFGIGLSNDFGMPTGVGVASFAAVKETKITKVYGTSSVALDEAIASVTVDAVARTIAPVTAPQTGGTVDFEFSYNYQLRA